MKKSVSLLVSLSILASCSTLEEPMSTTADSPRGRMESRFRTPDEAIDVARRASADFFPSKSRSAKAVSFNGVKVIKAGVNSRNASDTLLYIVNFDNKEGFAIVNANRKGVELYAISDCGNYDDSDKSLNPPGLNMYIEEALAGVSKKDSLDITDPIWGNGDGKEPFMQQKTFVDTLENIHFEPRVKVRWVQGEHWGKYFSNGHCGCSALSLLQALSYFKKPTYMYFIDPTIPYSYIELPWDAMIDYSPMEARLIIKSDPETEYMLLSDINGYFAKEVAYRMCAKIDGASTTTSIGNLFAAVKEIATNICRDLTVSELYASYSFSPSAMYSLTGVTVMTGSGTSELYDFSHAWIVDGYRGLRTVTKECVKYDYEDTWRVLTETENAYSYAHINWGWGGTADGWYYSSPNGSTQLYTADIVRPSETPTYHGFNYMKIEPVLYNKVDPDITVIP